MTQLPPDLRAQVQRLRADGDEAAARGCQNEAIAFYNDAWKCVPEPKTQWENSAGLLATVGDAAFRGSFFRSGVGALRYALQCPGGATNPFVQLRLGQCEFELNRPAKAAEHLGKAYALAGAAIFSDEHPKYFDILKARPGAT